MRRTRWCSWSATRENAFVCGLLWAQATGQIAIRLHALPSTGKLVGSGPSATVAAQVYRQWSVLLRHSPPPSSPHHTHTHTHPHTHTRAQLSSEGCKADACDLGGCVGFFDRQDFEDFGFTATSRQQQLLQQEGSCQAFLLEIAATSAFFVDDDVASAATTAEITFPDTTSPRSSGASSSPSSSPAQGGGEAPSRECFERATWDPFSEQVLELFIGVARLQPLSGITAATLRLKLVRGIRACAPGRAKDAAWADMGALVRQEQSARRPSFGAPRPFFEELGSFVIQARLVPAAPACGGPVPFDGEDETSVFCTAEVLVLANLLVTLR